MELTELRASTFDPESSLAFLYIHRSRSAPRIVVVDRLRFRSRSRWYKKIKILHRPTFYFFLTSSSILSRMDGSIWFSSLVIVTQMAAFALTVGSLKSLDCIVNLCCATYFKRTSISLCEKRVLTSFTSHRRKWRGWHGDTTATMWWNFHKKWYFFNSQWKVLSYKNGVQYFYNRWRDHGIPVRSGWINLVHFTDNCCPNGSLFPLLQGHDYRNNVTKFLPEIVYIFPVESAFLQKWGQVLSWQWRAWLL